MKKFLKNKFDFTENSNQSPFHGTEHSPTNTFPEPITTLEEQRALLEKASQPPLPLEPPPTTPIDFSLHPKQETDDYEYQGRLGSPTLSLHKPSEVSSLSATNHDPSQAEVGEKKICRDFIRGTCSRGGTCKYAHKVDLSQLPGIYTFCYNFQNTVCTYPHCKYVHASIFEEQKFYRTGKLPPHALAHHKKPPPVAMPTFLPPLLLPPPPPPPEEPAPPPVPVEVSMFAAPQPVLVPSVEKPLISCVPTANLEARPMDDFIPTAAPRDIEHKTKKCKNCDTMEFRLQFNKDKAENMRQSTVELKNKVARLSKKSQTLYTVLLSLMKPQVSKRPEGLNGLSMSSLLSIVGDSEKNVLSNLLLKDASDQSLVSETRDPCS